MSDDQSFRMSLLEGKNRFNSARGRAFWKEMINFIRGKPMELLSFDDIRSRLRLREESYKGLQDIPLDKIVGSVGRYREFTRDFLPKSAGLQERWSRVYAQANSLTGLPPIEVYKVDDLYFVRDGNHRVSVARQIGAKTIQGHVTELPTTIDLRPDMSPSDLDDAVAYAAFLEETSLGKTRLHHQPLQLSERSRYADLLGHIFLYQALLSHEQNADIDLPAAAAHWYDNVYRPAITLIRKYEMTDILGGRTEADLYLWLVDHLRDLREQLGDYSPSHTISDAIEDFLEKRNIPIPDELRQEKDSSVILSRTQIMRAVELKKQQEQNLLNGLADDDNEHTDNDI
jgi:hypothetical protein